MLWEKIISNTLRTAELEPFLGSQFNLCQDACWLIIERGYMVLCGYCRKNVKPKMYLTWKGFIYGLCIFYLMYIITKIPQCPNCNFPMPRRSMLFAIRPPQCLIKLARKSVLQLIYFKDGVISVSGRFNLNRRFDPSQHFANKYTNTKSHLSGIMASEFMALLEEVQKNDRR